MDKITLKSIIEGKSYLNEDITEPSEQVLKGVMALFKQATGMNPAFPAIKTKSKRLNTITYTTSLNKEIRTSLTKILFSNIDLNITVNEVPNTIGGYEFKFSIHYTHPDGHDNTYYIGSVNFVNNKLTPKFN